MARNDFVVRDSRDGSFLWMDKQVMSFISRRMGNSAVVIYSWLCYYANAKKQNCFPSFATLAEHTNLSRRTVIRLIKKLEKSRIIAIEREFGHVNVYRLLQVDAGISSSRSGDTHDTSDTCDTGGGAPVSLPVVSPEHHEQDRFEQDLFNKTVAALFPVDRQPSAEELKALTALFLELKSRIDLVSFMKTLRKRQVCVPPPVVMIKVCMEFKAQGALVRAVWPWFQRVVKSETGAFNAAEHVREHEDIKKQPARLDEILAGIARHGA